MQLANSAAGLVVARLGTAVVTRAELAEAVNAAEAGLLRHTEEMDAHVSRGSDRVRLRMECWVEEDEATGRVVNAGYTQRLADDTVSMAFGYHDDRVDIMSTSGGQESRSSIPAPSVGLQFVGLAAADRAFRAALAGGEEVWEAAKEVGVLLAVGTGVARSRRQAAQGRLHGGGGAILAGAAACGRWHGGCNSCRTRSAGAWATIS